MPTSTQTLIPITLIRNNWETISGILKSVCPPEDAKWVEWARYARGEITGRFGKSTQPGDPVTVKLNRADWKAIVKVLNRFSRGKKEHWVEWSKTITHTIRAGIEDLTEDQLAQQVPPIPPPAEIPQEIPQPQKPQRTSANPYNVSSEAYSYYQKAWDLWDKAGEKDKNNALNNDCISLFMLAISKAGGPFPRAHSWLAIFLQDLQREKEAAQHAAIALQEDPYEFRAQLVKIDLSLNNVKVMKKGAGALMPNLNQSAESAAVEFVFNGIFMGGHYAHTRKTQNDFKKEVLKLIDIYRYLNTVNTDVDEFLYMSELMVSYGDGFRDIPMPGGRPNLFAEVVNAPINRLIMRGCEQDVQLIRDKAEGRSMLFKG